jgi:hypothetical protein
LPGTPSIYAQNIKPQDTLIISESCWTPGEHLELTASFNNDTFNDYCILLRNYKTQSGDLKGKIIIYYGDENNHKLTPSLEIEGLKPLYQPSGGLNDMVSGDLNGDGFDEVIFGSINTGISQLNRGYIAICFSDKDGIDTTNIVQINGKSSYGSYSCRLFIDDINGDEINDLIVGARFDYFFEGQIFIYYGGTDFDTVPDKILYFPGSYSFHIQYLADLNSDGITDIVARDNINWRLDRFRYHIFFGGKNISETPDYSVETLKFSPHSIQDLDSDGNEDMILQSDESENLFKIFFGRQDFNFANPVDTVIKSFPAKQNPTCEFVVKFKK